MLLWCNFPKVEISSGYKRGTSALVCKLLWAVNCNIKSPWSCFAVRQREPLSATGEKGVLSRSLLTCCNVNERLNCARSKCANVKHKCKSVCVCVCVSVSACLGMMQTNNANIAPLWCMCTQGCKGKRQLGGVWFQKKNKTAEEVQIMSDRSENMCY